MPLVPTADRPHKHARIRELLDASGAEALLLTVPENLAWFFDGARATVPAGGPAVFSALIPRDGTPIVSALENESQRLADEEIAGAEIRSVPWFTQVATALEGSPQSVLRDTDAVAAMRAVRAPLLPVERARYADLGADIARALTDVLSSARPDQSEHELAADLSRAVVAVGATPHVVLVAGEARGAVQHPLPTAAPLGDRAMAVIGAVRHGLHLSATRWVRFRGAEREEEARLRDVEAAAFAATRPGRSLGEVMDAIAAAYAIHGFGTARRPAWRSHHQGGPTGYLGRDPKAAPGSDVPVVAGGAFAWNPWVPRAKIEDTVIVGDAGVEVLSADPRWPTVTVNGLPRPATLELI